MAFSLITDIVWLIYWGATWGSYKNREMGICTFTIIVSVITFLLKIIIVILTFLNEPECKSAITDIGSNIKSIFKGPSEYTAV